jgi:2-succinyl-5-enolpyruvyl-6-hydroxy-3-cyclohexene-1-carboxylate synthase
MRLQPIFDIAGICSRKGIKDAIVCPGSRCAPLTLAFVRQSGIQTRTISDERSAGFIALGIAQQTKRTVVLICTSGTAAYNFAPAVAEAYYQRIPLLILTADRPTEWIGQWDGQTISQQNIYGDHVKRSYNLPQEYEHPDSKWSIYRSINEAVNLTQEGHHGPVHVNVPLREPLYPPAGETISFSDDIRITERVTTKITLPAKTLQQLSAALEQSKKVLVVGGQGSLSVNLVASLNSLATSGDVAVVGDVISNLHPLPSAIRYPDVFLAQLEEKVKKDLQPDLLITIGQSVISKNLKLFLRANKPIAHWHVDEETGPIIDPFQSVTTLVQQNPEDLFAALSKAAKENSDRKQYVQKWQALEQKTANAIKDFFREEDAGELSFVNHVMHEVPDHTSLHLANSMAVRYANFCGLGENKKGVQLFSNRGTSGIDGCTSTVVGHALSSDSMHTLITGDLAFFYDRNAFWNNYNVRNLRVIVLNNHGGAIFGMIDGPASQPEVDEYFVTRQTLTARNLADEFSLSYRRINTNENVAAVLEDFYKPGEHAKILEFESTSKEVKELFLRFKDKIKGKLKE